MSITASCHHKLKDWEDLGVPVEYEGETRDCVAEAANEIRQRVADLE